MEATDTPYAALPLQGEHGLGAFPQKWLILGVTGSTTLFTSYFLVLFLPWFYNSSSADNEFSSLVFLAGISLTFLAAFGFSDRFRTHSDRMTLFVSSTVLCALSACAVLLSSAHSNGLMQAILLLIFAIGLTAQAMLWTICFSSIRRGVIGPFLAATLLVSGVFFSVICLLQEGPRLVISAFLPLMSAGIYLFLEFKLMRGYVYQIATESKKRYSISKRSLYTTMITGLPLGVAAFYVTDIGVESVWVSLVVGLPFMVSGTVMLADAVHFKAFSESSFLQRFSTLVVLPFLVMPFLPAQGKLVCCAYIALVLGCNTVMCFVAIAEVTSFNKLAVFRAFGVSWFLYALGLAFGWVLPWVAQSFFTADIVQVAVLLGLGYLIVASGLIFRDNSVSEEPSSSEIGAKVKSTSWKEKVKRVAEVYELSPRQQEVLTMLARGRNAGYLQEHFYISRSTAKAHIYNIYKKLGVHSQQGLIDFIEDMDVTKEP